MPGAEDLAGGRASVVIPAHDEAEVIGRLLDALHPAVLAGELAVYVICNGCRDATAKVAARRRGVEVAELAEASKIAALNLGDRLAGSQFPRLYIDADVSTDLDSVRRVVAALRDGPELAAAPRLEVRLDGRPAVVRGFYEIFLRTGWATDSPIGSGFYGLSRDGRSRFGEFPDVINDDLFVRSRYSSEERLVVADAAFAVEAPHSTWALVRAKARVRAGTRQFVALEAAGRPKERARVRSAAPHPVAARPAAGPAARWGTRLATRLRAWRSSPLWTLARDPALWLPLAGYASVRGAAMMLVVWSSLGRRQLGWGQDRTTRRSQP